MDPTFIPSKTGMLSSALEMGEEIKKISKISLSLNLWGLFGDGLQFSSYNSLAQVPLTARKLTVSQPARRNLIRIELSAGYGALE